MIDVHVNRKYRNLCMPRLRYNAIRETDEQTKGNNHFPLINIYFFRCSVCYIVRKNTAVHSRKHIHAQNSMKNVQICHVIVIFLFLFIFYEKCIALSHRDLLFLFFYLTDSSTSNIEGRVLEQRAIYRAGLAGM